MKRSLSHSMLAKLILAAGLMTASIVGGVSTAAGSLDELLEQTRSARERETKANQEREAKFLAERNKQAALMSEARAELTEQRNRSASLTAAFDGNEKKLTDLQAQLDSRAGNLGEMFGVVRQVASDFSSVVGNSIISAQYPGRAEFVTKLAQAKTLPSMTDLERFWFELQREMTETGKVAKYNTQVVSPEGTPTNATVVRIGPFSATTGGRYLSYLPSQGRRAIWKALRRAMHKA